MLFAMDYGVKFMPVNPNMPYRVAMASGEPAKFAAAMLEEIKERKVHILRNACVMDLIMTAGKVVGVKVDRKGKESEIFGKSVILATGGFINNEYLVKRYKRYWGVLPSFITGYGDTSKDHTGDGIMMGKKHGAALEDMESMAKFFSRPKVGTPSVSWLIVDIEPAYVVSPDAKRVTNENASRYSGICLDLIRAGYKHGFLLLGSETVGGKNEKGSACSML